MAKGHTDRQTDRQTDLFFPNSALCINPLRRFNDHEKDNESSGGGAFSAVMAREGRRAVIADPDRHLLGCLGGEACRVGRASERVSEPFLLSCRRKRADGCEIPRRCSGWASFLEQFVRKIRRGRASCEGGGEEMDQCTDCCGGFFDFSVRIRHETHYTL